MKSKIGIALAGMYIFGAVYLVMTQGLTGESFIAIILGLPWTLGLAAFEFGGAEGTFLYGLLIFPMIINAILLYWVGSLIRRPRR